MGSGLGIISTAVGNNNRLCQLSGPKIGLNLAAKFSLPFIIYFLIIKNKPNITFECPHSKVGHLERGNVFDKYLGHLVEGSLAVTTAFLTGVDKKTRSEDMVQSVIIKKKRTLEANMWTNDWIGFSESVLSINKFPNMKISGTKSVEDEINTFTNLKQLPSKPLNYWKNEHRFILIKVSAKILLVVPVSSAAVEHLYSSVGMLLTQLNKQMPLTFVINCVYKIRTYAENHGNDQ
ncbi:hypothetical protein RF11_01304 [Thelohanellus kitauei]|uniref:HAT C-terminal dimerisation domain-containing protein n=1 Tax=Thelohanellus kitauei TaxID=669202 RepID=A0A0C2MR35_THEKT|nr:hypothetical protein RF11_01304 [Thelohanellus kitauei]